MGGGNAQKAAMARARNAERNASAKVKFSSELLQILSNEFFFTCRMSGVEQKEKRHEVVRIWRKLWLLLQVFILLLQVLNF